MRIKGIVKIDGKVYHNTITTEGVELLVSSIVNSIPIHPTNLLILTALPNDVAGIEFEDYKETITLPYYLKATQVSSARTNTIIDTVEATFNVSSLPAGAAALALVYDGTHNYSSEVKFSGNEKIFSVITLPENPGSTLTWSLVFEIDEG